MRKSLAEIVVEEKLAEPDKVAAAEKRARRAGEPLIVTLVEGDRVAEDAVLAALRRHTRLPLVGDADPEPEAIREVPHELAKRRRILPVALEHAADTGRTLRVAMADPTDRDAIAEVEIATGCRIEAVLIGLGAADQAIAHAYRGIVTAIIKTDKPAPRKPFGGDLHVATPTTHGPPAHLGTEPYHRLEDEAPLEVRHKALLDVLYKKGLVTEEEYLAAVRDLLRGRE